ncbi:hypothetical protein EBT16_04230 [bacterium]|nr:hypothetical protein [bacterium]
MEPSLQRAERCGQEDSTFTTATALTIAAGTALIAQHARQLVVTTPKVDLAFWREAYALRKRDLVSKSAI